MAHKLSEKCASRGTSQIAQKRLCSKVKSPNKKQPEGNNDFREKKTLKFATVMSSDKRSYHIHETKTGG